MNRTPLSIRNPYEKRAREFCFVPLTADTRLTVPYRHPDARLPALRIGAVWSIGASLLGVVLINLSETAGKSATDPTEFRFPLPLWDWYSSKREGPRAARG